MDDIIRWNGVPISAKSAILTLDGVPYTGIVGLDYGDKLDVETVHDMQRNGVPIGATSGKYTVEGFKMTVLKDVWILKMLTQLNAMALLFAGTGYGAARFTFVAQYQEGPLVGTDTLLEARIIGTRDSVQEGSGKLVVECDCWARLLLRNGTSLADLTRLP